MMKRILVIAILSLIFNIQSFAQCIPDTSIHASGITPDSATGLSPATQGMPYNQVLQIRVPADTVIIFTVPIDSVRLISFTGLPPGLSYSCTPPSCSFNGGTNGCIQITGTPTDTGYFPLTAVVEGYAAGIGTPLINQTLTYYSITVSQPSGLAEFSSNNFAVKQNSPNPFSDYSVISYNLPHKGEVEFKMFNLLGKEVYHSRELANAGVNDITIDASKFSPGAYMYSVIFDNNTLTKSLVISER